MVCLSASMLMICLASRYWVVPLVLYMGLCLAGPFMIGISLFLPVISRGNPKTGAVALTFDDGPDRHSTPAVLDLLERNRITATFFVIGSKAKKNPDLIDAIIRKGHGVANHSFDHDPFLMLRSPERIESEIRKTHDILLQHRIVPTLFRPPAGITGPRLGPALARFNLSACTFSCRGADFGNRRISGLSQRIAKKARPGDIVLLHDSMPPGGRADLGLLIRELDRLVLGLKKKGLGIESLEDLAGRPVMTRL